MGNAKRKITNWSHYNKELVHRGSLRFRIDEQAIKSWSCSKHHGSCGRGYIYSDVAIETALVVKGVFNLLLRALEGFTPSVFQLMDVTLTSPSYSCISKRAKTVNIKYCYRVVTFWHM